MQAADERSFCPRCNAVFRTPFSRCPLDGTELAGLEGDPLVGTTIDERYEIIECIGEGGMGRVYRAKHTRMSRHFAIKVLFGDHAGDTRMRSRFAREAEAVSRLNHVNVIAVVDFGETKGGLLYLVMDLANGDSLTQVVRREAPFTQDRAAFIMAQLARGLAHAHAQGLVHRDFKSENVIMAIEDGVEVPKIVDFGICMIVEDSPSNTMLTSNGMIMGTPAMMAPEQASGDIVDHRTDLFALGLVSYQMLAGCLPFEGSPLDMARKNLYEPIPPIAARGGVQVDPTLEAIVQKLTAKNPEERYQSAREAQQALQFFLPDMSSQDWFAPTPTPFPLRPVTGSESSQQFPAAGHSATVMVSAPESALSSKGKGKGKGKGKAVAMAAGAFTLVLGVALIASVSGNSAEPAKAASSEFPTAAAAPTPAASGIPAAGGEPTETASSKSEGQPTESETAESETAESESAESQPAAASSQKDEAKEEPEKKSRARARARRKARQRKKNRANKRRKPPKSSAPKDPELERKALLKKTSRLYQEVAVALDRLEKSQGPAAVADLRRDYNSISYSRLMRDASMQPIYHQSLVRLRGKIRARRRNR